MRRLLVALAAVLTAATAVAAQELRIGLAATVTSLDPHFHVIGSNAALARNLFDGLVNQDDSQRIIPGLAESWRAIDATTWEFRLRDGARFHDGSPVTAEDVAASLRRVPSVRNSPSSFLPFVRPITGLEVVDARTIRLRTATPFPLMANSLSRIAIMPRASETAETSDLNAGRGLIGSGPFRLIRHAQGDRVEMAATDPQNPWQRVSFRFVTNDAGRVSALLVGELDLIEQVLTADSARLRRDSRIAMASAASNRVMYLHPTRTATARPSPPRGTAAPSRARCAMGACATRSRWRSTATRWSRASRMARARRRASSCPRGISATCPRSPRRRPIPPPRAACWRKPACPTVSR